MDAFYGAGALVFGGGHVVLPLLNEAVAAHARELDLAAASEGIPAVYEVDGREYIAIATGGNGYLTQPCLATDPPIPAPGPSEYRVYALPKR